MQDKQGFRLHLRLDLLSSRGLIPEMPDVFPLRRLLEHAVELCGESVDWHAEEVRPVLLHGTQMYSIRLPSHGWQRGRHVEQPSDADSGPHGRGPQRGKLDGYAFRV